MHLDRFVADLLLLPAIHCFSFLHPPVRLEPRAMKIVPRQAYFGKDGALHWALSFMPCTLDTGVYKDRAPAPIGRLVMPVNLSFNRRPIFTTTATTATTTTTTPSNSISSVLVFVWAGIPLHV